MFEKIGRVSRDDVLFTFLYSIKPYLPNIFGYGTISQIKFTKSVRLPIDVS